MVANPIGSQDSSEREDIRAILAGNIRHLDDRVQNAWEDDLSTEAERLQLTRLRTMSQLARQYRLLVRDEDIDEMESELELLQKATDLQEGSR